MKPAFQRTDREPLAPMGADPLFQGPEARPFTVSVVIPVYNSEATIDSLCEQLIKELAPHWRLQIVLVDDGSRDRSAAACRRLHARHQEIITCILLARNFGEHNAVMAGLNHADGDYCVIMDDDFQNPPAEVAPLVQEITKGYDVVYVRYEQKHHNWWRNLGSWLHNKMATLALGKPPDLYLSSFKVMSRFVVKEAVQYTGPDPYLDAIILRTTRRIGVIASKHELRDQGVSGYTFSKLISLWGNMIAGFSIYPLRIVGVVGGLIAIMGILLGVFTLVALRLPETFDLTQFETFLPYRWIIRGSTLLAVCIIGEYVGRIYRHLNRTPQFIIRELLLSRGRGAPACQRLDGIERTGDVSPQDGVQPLAGSAVMSGDGGNARSEGVGL